MLSAAHWNETHVLSVPGDFNTDTVTITGSFFQINVAHGGAVFLDAGRIVLNSDNTIAFEAGPHMYFDSDLTKLCSVLV